MVLRPPAARGAHAVPRPSWRPLRRRLVLADPSGWIRAVDAYNPSIDYNHRVAAAADEYAALAG
ncbi:hypothetical protein DEU37_0612 [Microbacterium sp. AG790]|uniref:hypothetical protein n=1 Tax=Microbacterium sp. AG790 TaxID=2183995 RepID=UPI000F1EEB05|nr:hypothetical protein [Microbacterium sp. AG790]RKS93210.1 hypothetical protein DEU37_0612 [Microbacterium sp. AG790]